MVVGGAVVVEVAVVVVVVVFDDVALTPNTRSRSCTSPLPVSQSVPRYETADRVMSEGGEENTGNRGL